MKSFEELVKIPMGAVWLMNSIAEYKGKQELYLRQSPQVLKTLRDIALVESAESSNRIEGITVNRERLKPILLGKSKPKDRSEEEVVGYRNALNLIHDKNKNLEISAETIKTLHKLCQEGVWDEGKWKSKDNELIRKNPDGSVNIVFKPVSAKNTPEAVKNLCLLYKHSINQWKYPPLYAVACLILDFLCIHPFRDGNGRVSRLLTLLALYHHNFEVGKYISLEKIIEDSKETYYDSLHKSSSGWHKGKHNIEPWLYYFLGGINSAYRKFEERALSVKPVKGAKKELVRKTINNQVGEFTLGDIIEQQPGISRETIKLILRELQKGKRIKCLGKGRNAKWKRIG